MKRLHRRWGGWVLGLALVTIGLPGCQAPSAPAPVDPPVTLAPEAPAVQIVETPPLAELAGEYELDLTAEEREAFGGDGKVPRLLIRANGTYVLILPNEEKRIEGKTQWSKERLVLAAGAIPSEEDVTLNALSDGALKEQGAEGLAFRRKGSTGREADPAAFGEAPAVEPEGAEVKEAGQ